jgi:hypothetical protein
MIGGPFKGALLMAKIQITDNEDVVLSIDLKAPTLDKKGNPAAPVDSGSVQWFVDNPALATLGPPTDDGTTASVKLSAVGPLGTVNVSVKATAGGNACAGTEEVDIGSDAPAVININAGTPTEQP